MGGRIGIIAAYHGNSRTTSTEVSAIEVNLPRCNVYCHPLSTPPVPELSIMSLRPKPGAAERPNQQVIKDLLKLNCNKTCADCKRNKRMGTHVSRVKSVDLDSWTDEQLQSVVRWGNARANKYWEAKLPPGHVPSEAKIENFIRTKYESKRWVMDGPIPDPSTLDGDGDEDVPLAVVQEKAKLERSASHQATSTLARPSPPAQQQSINLFDDDAPAPPTRPKTTDIPGTHAPTKSSQPAAAPKQGKPGDSLLGLDFFRTSQPTTASRPSSTPSVGYTRRLQPYRPPKPKEMNSSFNLSSSKHHTITHSPPSNAETTTSMLSSVNIDPWGGNAWASTDPSPPTTQPTSMMRVPDTLTANDIGSGWGASSGLGGSSAPKPTPTVTADEDFGGWTSAVPTETSTSAPKAKTTGGFLGNDDLFSNVWE
ncbi:Smap1 protein [Coccidioides immitis H538.4]|uniref:Smap1 protein n=1 Tax=Coccidioides immitis H538.4 TaxID=396776 RepID=A0A0J8RI95_COCIT|nr:Smap1 protein [Coccidioides immitis H538.4]